MENSNDSILDKMPLDFFGCLKDTVIIKGDIVNPIASWEVEDPADLSFQLTQNSG